MYGRLPGRYRPVSYTHLMYAIVEINGQQFKAEAGQKLFVHHIEGAENGSTVESVSYTHLDVYKRQVIMTVPEENK